ncbi:MAG: 2-C-methyl-D-erythritol 4-phosphate cytidylyltransferase [Bacteroidales bacterium]|nr:2-C-methyl-D-erythritol 4-phosphate cytidylyltransferase [Bacteroidales bacterium]MDD4670094.1 2-C-methyl-D-erythritol 4-phosphate cytidylyltransferase [Bacteroidales bacterium]
MNKQIFTIILAAGEGKRMGGNVSKQFVEIEGKPILRHTIEQFLSLDMDMEIIVVLPPLMKESWKQYCRESGFLSRYIMASGGITRFHSVQNAMKYVPENAIVAVHDGVRPFVTKEFLISMFREAENSPALVPVLPAVDSMREIVGNGNSAPVDRSKYVLVQTPQIFHSEILLDAYRQAFSPAFTDDASVAEAAGYKVKLCPGSRYNLKITTPEDLKVATAIFQSRR